MDCGGGGVLDENSSGDENSFSPLKRGEETTGSGGFVREAKSSVTGGENPFPPLKRGEETTDSGGFVTTKKTDCSGGNDFSLTASRPRRTFLDSLPKRIIQTPKSYSGPPGNGSSFNHQYHAMASEPPPRRIFFSSILKKAGLPISNQKMEYVKPVPLFLESLSRQQCLICVYIGTKYISVAVSTNHQHTDVLLVSVHPKDVSLGSIAEELSAELAVQYNIRGIIFGNCVNYHYDEKCLELVQYLSEKGNFTCMEYTHWNNSDFETISNRIPPFNPQFIRSNRGCLPRWREKIEKSLAGKILSMYLSSMTELGKRIEFGKSMRALCSTGVN